MRVKWTLLQAAEFCGRLSAHLGIWRYAVGLTGSVLTVGESHKDLDLIIYPFDSSAPDLPGVYVALESFGMKQLYPREVVTARWRRLGSEDVKHVEVWEYQRRRVDLFFLS